MSKCQYSRTSLYQCFDCLPKKLKTCKKIIFALNVDHFFNEINVHYFFNQTKMWQFIVKMRESIRIGIAFRFNWRNNVSILLKITCNSFWMIFRCHRPQCACLRHSIPGKDFALYSVLTKRAGGSGEFKKILKKNQNDISKMVCFKSLG